MPLYFAYGANLDIAAMRRRCPGAQPVCAARLPGHAFFIMPDGVASVCRRPGAMVHGLLWQLLPSDVAPLDDFEDVAGGLYTKIIQPVLKPLGSARAFLYVGHATQAGQPRPGYIKAVVAAARAAALPDAYCHELAGWGRSGTRGPAFTNDVRDAAAGPVAGVRPRYASPLDRG